jgi:hypothetical protein
VFFRYTGIAVSIRGPLRFSGFSLFISRATPRNATGLRGEQYASTRRRA